MRIKLSEKYLTEREEICNKIITILDLKEDLFNNQKKRGKSKTIS